MNTKIYLNYPHIDKLIDSVIKFTLIFPPKILNRGKLENSLLICAKYVKVTGRQTDNNIKLPVVHAFRSPENTITI